jgi:hypothetical protein
VCRQLKLICAARRPTPGPARGCCGAAIPPAAITSSLRSTQKNTLKAVVDIAVPKWHLKFPWCMWHEKNGKQWIRFSNREWTDRQGTKKYENLVEFNRETAPGFQAVALAAVKVLAGAGAQ